MLWEVIKFGVAKCLEGLVTGGASFATPIAFLGLLWSRIFRSPSFLTLVRIAAFCVIVGTAIVVRWQQQAILRELEEIEKINAEGACFRNERCDILKKTDPAIRYHEVHAKQCDTDKWRCENSAEDRAWSIWVGTIPGWGDILKTLESKFIMAACITFIVSYILPWFTSGPTRAAGRQFVTLGEKQLAQIIEAQINPTGAEPLHED